MADSEIQGMEAAARAPAPRALLGRKRGQEEGHGLPILLGHDGGPGGRAEHIAVFLSVLLPPRAAGVKGLDAGSQQPALFGAGDRVSAQDPELVATILLTQATHDLRLIVILRSRRPCEGKREHSKADQHESLL